MQFLSRSYEGTKIKNSCDTTEDFLLLFLEIQCEFLTHKDKVDFGVIFSSSWYSE